MKFGVPWKVKGIRPDARESAREAARRAGMSLGEWLNTVILESAVEEGVRPRSGGYADQDDDDAYDNDTLFSVHERLDELTRHLERLNRTAAAAPIPEPRHFRDQGRDELAESIARLDRRLDQFVSEARRAAQPQSQPQLQPRYPQAPAAGDPWVSVDLAVAEITARQQALDADPHAPPPRPGPVANPAFDQPAPRVPEQNLSGLEEQLRHVTTQIEALRPQKAVEEGIVALRASLAEIARTLTEAMPRRAIEALENEVRALASRLDSSRGPGADASTLTAVERGLAEVRDSLRSLTPAENLDGFREAVRNLAQKIDQLAAGPDLAAFQQLEAAISTLRGIVSHVASNESLGQLAAEVRALAAKIDQVSHSSGADALGILEKRVAHIADALEARAQNGGSVPPQLEAVIKGLSEKIERIQLSRGDSAAVGNLEDRIAQLVEKLDASGARFSQLEAIEKGLGDLLAHIEAQRAAGSAPVPAGLDGLQRDLARTQTSLEAVHGALGHVVDRLAMLEGGIREGQQRPEAKIPAAAPQRVHPPANPAPLPNPPDRAMAAAQAAAAMAKANPRARSPIDPNLPPDQPLEPGSSTSRPRLSASPADRIAASEAALGSAKPPVIADPGGKSNFIAAARRAAQAAAADPTPADLRAVASHQDTPEQKLPKTLAQRVRSLFAGASVILIVGGSLHIGANMTDPRPPTVSAEKQPETEVRSPEKMASQTRKPPVQIAPNGGAPDLPAEVTGAIQAPPLYLPAVTMPTPQVRAAQEASDVPASIGGEALRRAATSGDAAAQYEIGVRYAEGRGVGVNATEAVKWLEAAARQNLALAQLRLAAMYEKGIGIKKDVEAARRFYKAAAEQGNAQAMHNLAVLYAEGAAVKPDYRTAAQWFRLAADHGISDSQYNLAILYARGIGVDQNLAESYKWFALAANQGDREAGHKRDEVAKRLDATTLAAARLAIDSFKAQPQPDAATKVSPPPGGWDAPAKTDSGAAKVKPRAAGPIKIGSR